MQFFKIGDQFRFSNLLNQQLGFLAIDLGLHTTPSPSSGLCKGGMKYATIPALTLVSLDSFDPLLLLLADLGELMESLAHAIANCVVRFGMPHNKFVIQLHNHDIKSWLRSPESSKFLG
jgi:hypothetical protein